jgi:hypothetical protein
MRGAVLRTYYGTPCCLHEGYHQGVGRTLIIIGLVLIAAGVLMTLGARLPVKLGRLPGDIVVRGKNSVFYFPIVTCLVVSAILSLVMWLAGRR